MSAPNTDEPFVFPTHCFWCGVYLMGGATVHKEGCFVLDMIRARFFEPRDEGAK